MEDLDILPGESSGGIAIALMEEVIPWYRERGVTAILVTRTPEGDRKHKLLEFYLRQGFSSQGRLILERSLTERSRFHIMLEPACYLKGRQVDIYNFYNLYQICACAV